MNNEHHTPSPASLDIAHPLPSEELDGWLKTENPAGSVTDMARGWAKADALHTERAQTLACYWASLIKYPQSWDTSNFPSLTAAIESLLKTGMHTTMPGQIDADDLKVRFSRWADRKFGPTPDPRIPQWERFATYFEAYCAALSDDE